MKFLCLPCDRVMAFTERQLPGDGTMATVFLCEGCGREMALLTNPMETQLVSSMGVKVGGREVPAQPMEGIRTSLAGGSDEAFRQADGAGLGAQADPPALPQDTNGWETAVLARPGPVDWSPDAVERLQKVPGFVRGMVKRIYVDYARERGICTLTPGVMDQARIELGLEGM